ncbi:MAG: hypothetical protein N3E43_06025 [Sulfolobales archaeon]|nr:hypothetical protein [Sulfolobales archaeon]
MSFIFSVGIEGLDRILGYMKTPYLLVIAGHPGAGKTTLASTICYKNALLGRKCLYISFYEDKERLYSYMSHIGIDLAEAESRGYLKFVRLPVGVNVQNSTQAILSAISEDSYGIVVLDSINTLLEGVIDDAEKRAWLTNFFYNIPSIIRGLCILIAELPYGSEKLEINGLEFVADAVLILKQRIEEGFLVRTLEVRKARGAPVVLADIPFSIVENEGVRLWLPPVIEHIDERREVIELPCEALRRVWGHIHRGFVINVVYPQNPDYRDLLVPVLATAMTHGLRVLMISYKHPPHSIREALEYRLAKVGVDREVVEKVVSEHFKFMSINPFSYSLTQLVIRENSIIDSEKPDAVVFHGVEVSRLGVPLRSHIVELYNQMNYLKKMGVVVIRIGSYTGRKTYDLESRVSDVVLRFYYGDKGSDGSLSYRALTWRRHSTPKILDHEELIKCVEESSELIKKRLTLK